jgi:hypothetical protein
MPEGPIKLPEAAVRSGLGLRELKEGGRDAIGATVQRILFRGGDYAIYRSDRGVYVHFADDDNTEHAQRSAYVKLSVQICELRYLTSQMRAAGMSRFIGWFAQQDTLYDHNMGQALMLLMESVAQQTAGQATEATATEQEAKNIAQPALDMAVRRVTVDNTIRYVRTCVVFGIFWLLAALTVYLLYANAGERQYYVLASVAGIIGAVFSVIVRAQAFNLKPCDDSAMNKLMSLIRVGMGGLAGPALVLLLMTLSVNALAGTLDFGKDAVGTPGFIRMIVIIGLLGGFAERLVPNLVQAAADKMESHAGTPGQAAQAANTDQAKAADPKSQQQITRA